MLYPRARPFSAPGLRGGGRAARRWAEVALWALLVLAGLFPIVLSVTTGALTMPHNDGWSHSRIAETWAREGRIELVSWNRPGLLGQVIPLGPLGDSFVAQNLFVVGCGVVAVVASYRLVRARASAPAAGLVALTLVANPEFGLLATSYMTDVPAMAGATLAIHLAESSLRRLSWSTLAAALAAAVWASTIREQMVVAVAVAAVAGFLLGRRTNVRWKPWLLTGVALVAILGYQWWRRSLTGDDPPVVDFSPGRLRSTTRLIAGTLALFLAPLVLAVARPLRWSRSTWLIAAGVSFIVGLWFLVRSRTLILGNYVNRHGAYSGVMPSREDMGARAVLSPDVWNALMLAVCLIMGLFAGVLLHHRRDLWAGVKERPLIAMAAALYLGGTVAQSLIGQGTFSRYLLLAVPLLAVFLVPLARVRLRVGLAGVVATLPITIALTSASMSFDVARWRAAEELARTGVPATHIDAGMEWVGYHSPRGAPGPKKWGEFGWYDPMFVDLKRCYQITPLHRPGWTVIDTTSYPTYEHLGSSKLYTYRFEDCRIPE